MSEGLRDIPACVPAALVNQQAQLVLDPLSDWQPVQLSMSWSHTITRLKIQSAIIFIEGAMPPKALADCNHTVWSTLKSAS